MDPTMQCFRETKWWGVLGGIGVFRDYRNAMALNRDSGNVALNLSVSNENYKEMKFVSNFAFSKR